MGRRLASVIMRVVRDPLTILLAAAAAIQAALAASPQLVVRPAWVVVAIVLFLAACVAAALGRIRGDRRLQLAAPFVLLVVAAAWRAADRQAVNGFGALGLVAVVWLAFYGTRRQVWIALAGVAALMVV